MYVCVCQSVCVRVSVSVFVSVSVCVCLCVGNLMVVALADMAGLHKVASFTLNNLFQPGDTIHTTFVEDTANSGFASY